LECWCREDGLVLRNSDLRRGSTVLVVEELRIRRPQVRCAPLMLSRHWAGRPGRRPSRLNRLINCTQCCGSAKQWEGVEVHRCVLGCDLSAGIPRCNGTAVGKNLVKPPKAKAGRCACSDKDRKEAPHGSISPSSAV
jgi:hypothetical protein